MSNKIHDRVYVYTFAFAKDNWTIDLEQAFQEAEAKNEGFAAVKDQYQIIQHEPLNFAVLIPMARRVRI